MRTTIKLRVHHANLTLTALERLDKFHAPLRALNVDPAFVPHADGRTTGARMAAGEVDGLVRPGPGTAIVGDPATVAATLEAHQEVGCDTFILSGMPLLEEAYRFAEMVMPRLSVVREEAKGKTFIWSNLFDRELSDTKGIV